MKGTDVSLKLIKTQFKALTILRNLICALCNLKTSSKRDFFPFSQSTGQQQKPCNLGMCVPNKLTFVHITGFGKFFYSKVCIGLDKNSNKKVIHAILSMIYALRLPTYNRKQNSVLNLHCSAFILWIMYIERDVIDCTRRMFWLYY